MTVDVEQSAQGPRAAQPNGNGNSGSPVSSPAVRYSTARHGQHVEESPDLLRWRADLLMDEMMMGGVDVSSADAAPRTFGGVEPSERMAPRPLEERPDPRRYPDTERDPNRFRGQVDAPSGRPPMTDARAGYPNPTTAADAEPRARPTAPSRGDFDYRSSGAAEGFAPDGDPRPASESSPLPSLRTSGELPPPTSSVETTTRSDRLYASEQRTEQRTEQLRRAASMPSAPAQPAPTPPPAAQAPTTPPRRATPARPAPPPDEQTRWATGTNKWEWQDFSASPADDPDSYPDAYPDSYDEPLYEAPRAARPPERAPDSAVRQDPAQFVSAMSVVGSNKRRSTLLPRMSTLDADTLQREISTLHGEISVLLPVGNETAERARHLLDKAYSILQSDPMRSAEVEYYMQQVRTIVQRLHQARQWSDLYRQRLQVYLWAWLGLSAVVVVARFVFQAEMDLFLSALLGAGPDSLLLRHWATWLGTAFAGSLGGALGALYTMRTHARVEQGFFDRKYGLRGLILPIIGLLVGMVGYVIFGLLFALLGINPAQQMAAGVVTALAAFGFGFSQESIYGTRS